jgi:uncharacterized membrane protein
MLDYEYSITFDGTQQAKPVLIGHKLLLIPIVTYKWIFDHIRVRRVCYKVLIGGIEGYSGYVYPLGVFTLNLDMGSLFTAVFKIELFTELFKNELYN